MIKIHFYNIPEDTQEHLMAENAHHAWSAIDEALQYIRSHQKHGALTADKCIDTVREILADARGRIE